MTTPSPLPTTFYGDVTALFIVALPGPSASEILLAAIGSQVHCFSLPTGRLLFTHTALPAPARIHGITSCAIPVSQPLVSTSSTRTAVSATWVVIHGDRFVSVAKLTPAGLAPLSTLPRLSGWTMAASIEPFFFPSDSVSTSTLKSAAAAVVIGLSDNSTEHYLVVEESSGTSKVELLARVECAERCLLYSMDLFPLYSRSPPEESQEESVGAVGACMVAAGTIFLDVVVWHAACAAGDDVTVTQTPVLYRLKGHEGSIHAVQWGPRGSTLVSGSDDRTLRLWNIPNAAPNLESNGVGVPVLLQPKCVLYGHLARLWAACFSADEAVVVSGSEDGSCRVWDAVNGQCLSIIKAHRSRGVWHCLLRGSTLFTGGADGGIKAWHLWDHLPASQVQRILHAEEEVLRQLSSTTPNLSSPCARPCPYSITTLQGQLPDPETTASAAVFVPSCGPEAAAAAPSPQSRFDSTAEWIRCLALADGGRTLFVATNRGLLHRVELPEEGSASFDSPRRIERWTTLYKSAERHPLCMLSLAESAASTRVAACNVEGRVVEVKLPRNLVESEEERSSAAWATVEWGSTDSTPIVGVYITPGLPDDLVLTTAGKGQLAAWYVAWGEENRGKSEESETPSLLASAVSPLRQGLVAAAAAPWAPPGAPFHPGKKENGEQEERSWAVMTGGEKGGVTLWRLDVSVSGSSSTLAPVTYVDAHGRSPVRSVAIRWETAAAAATGDSLEHGAIPKLPPRLVVESTGSNSAVVAFELVNGSRLVRLGERRFSSLLVVAGSTGMAQTVTGEPSNSPFDELALSSVSPASRQKDLVYGFKTTNFVVWSEAAEAEVCSVPCSSWRRPYALHVVSRDNLTFCFDQRLDKPIALYTRRPNTLSPRVSLPLALLPSGHGREINCVKIVRLGGGPGEFVCVTGGEDATVRLSSGASGRRVAFVGDHAGGTVVKAAAVAELLTEYGYGEGAKLLITTGSKLVICAWLLRPSSSSSSSSSVTAAGAAAENFFEDGREEWSESQGMAESELLSTHAAAAVMSKKNDPEGQPLLQVDHRYVAAAAFIPALPATPTANGASSPHLKPPAFVLAASSSGDVDLLALPLSPGARSAKAWQTWPLVARLQHHAAPALSLQHLALEVKGKIARFCHVVLTGGTDGGIVAWDLTPAVETFIKAASEQLPTCPTFSSTGKRSSSVEKHPWEPLLVTPMAIFSCAHQSGINGMSAAVVNAGSTANESLTEASVMVVTAGDDQSLCASQLLFSWSRGNDGRGENESALRCVLVGQVSEACAHSSAVRDVWTDGLVAFSTGLDQRVRRWKISTAAAAFDSSPEPPPAKEMTPHSAVRLVATVEEDSAREMEKRSNCQNGNSGGLRLAECGCIGAQVLEPFALDVVREKGAGGGEVEWVAVAGRGLQLLQWPCACV